MNFLRFLATNVYSERISTAEQNCTIKQKVVQLTAATNNQQIVAAVTAKKIRVLRVVLHALSAAAERVVFHDAAGANLASYWVPATGVAAELNVIDHAPIEGLWDGATATELQADNNSAAIINCTVRYIEFTP